MDIPVTLVHGLSLAAIYGLMAIGIACASPVPVIKVMTLRA